MALQSCHCSQRMQGINTGASSFCLGAASPRKPQNPAHKLRESRISLLLATTAFILTGTLQASTFAAAGRSRRSPKKLATQTAEPEPEYRGVPLDYLQPGMLLDGTVDKVYFPAGVIVDVGCERNGMLEVGEFSGGFPINGIPFKKGDKIKVRVLSVDKKKFYLTMRDGDLMRAPRRRTSRTPKQNVRPYEGREDWLLGDIDHMSAFGIFIRIYDEDGDGDPVFGLLPKANMDEEFAKQAVIGGCVKVRVAKVDVHRMHIEFTTFRK